MSTLKISQINNVDEIDVGSCCLLVKNFKQFNKFYIENKLNPELIFNLKNIFFKNCSQFKNHNPINCGGVDVKTEVKKPQFYKSESFPKWLEKKEMKKTTLTPIKEEVQKSMIKETIIDDDLEFRIRKELEKKIRREVEDKLRLEVENQLRLEVEDKLRREVENEIKKELDYEKKMKKMVGEEVEKIKAEIEKENKEKMEREEGKDLIICNELGCFVIKEPKPIIKETIIEKEVEKEEEPETFNWELFDKETREKYCECKSIITNFNISCDFKFPTTEWDLETGVRKIIDTCENTSKKYAVAEQAQVFVYLNKSVFDFNFKRFVRIWEREENIKYHSKIKLTLNIGTPIIPFSNQCFILPPYLVWKLHNRIDNEYEMEILI